jgi:hypothetical protein
MRIISDFHDYYDIGMQNGVDPQLPYQRFRREEEMKFPRSRHWREWWFSPYSWRSECYRIFYIGFAGKVWSCMDVAFNIDEPSLCFDPNLIEESFYIEFVKNRKKWDGRKYRPDSKYGKIDLKRTKKEVSECFEIKNRPELLDIFEKFKTAIFVYKLGSKTVVINECLDLYRFQKVLPPMQAFQELAMYVGSYLTKPVIEEPPISDKIKAEIHGFDKFSFRKGKQK